MKKLLVLLLTFLGLPAFVPPTRVEKRKEIQTTTSESERNFQKKKIKKSLLENLPSDLKNQILKLYPYDEGILNIPALAEGLTNLAATSKTLHAGINNPQNMLTILKSLPRAGAQVLAKGLRNMPAMKSTEVQDWFKNIILENGQELYNAIEAGYPDFQTIAKLLENPNIDVNWKDEHGFTALMEASWSYSTLVRQLLNAGADVNAKTYTGQTALMQASWWGKPKIVKVLLLSGADPLMVSKDKFIARDFAYTRRGWTSETTGRNDEVRKLLESAEKAQKEKATHK